MASLIIDIEARFARFEQALNQVKHSGQDTANVLNRAFGGLTTTLRAFGVALSAAAVGFHFKGIIDAADDLNTMNERTGVSVERLAGLRYAAEQTGTSFETVTGALDHLQRAMGEAGSGANMNLRRLFQDLKMEEAAKGTEDVYEALLKLADVFPRLNAATQARVAREFFGRPAKELKPLLKLGRPG